MSVLGLRTAVRSAVRNVRLWPEPDLCATDLESLQYITEPLLSRQVELLERIESLLEPTVASQAPSKGSRFLSICGADREPERRL